MERDDVDFVFVGNTTYGTINWFLEAGKLPEGLRIGPALDPHTGEYAAHWPTLIGKYALRSTISEGAIFKDTKGKAITLDTALNMALASAPRGRQ